MRDYYTVLVRRGDSTVAVGRFDSKTRANEAARTLRRRGHQVLEVAPIVTNLLDLHTTQRKARTA